MIALDIVTEAGAWPNGEPFPNWLGRAAVAGVRALPEPPRAPLAATLLLTDDAAVRDLNRDFRGQDKPTNVLSFPADLPARPGEPRALGDIALAYETVAREAQSEGKTLDDHAAHLVIHAVLHLLGHDHLDDDDASAMESLEVAALATLGIADPYADLAAGPMPA